MGKKKNKMTDERRNEIEKKLKSIEKCGGSFFVSAQEIRTRMKKIMEPQNSSTKAGYYKWWATEDTVKLILHYLGQNDSTFQSEVQFKNMEKKNLFERDKTNPYYCIYIGISDNLSSRLKNHVSGAIGSSGFRRHLGRLIWNSNPNQSKEGIILAINNFIGLLKIEYTYVQSDRKEIEDIETVLINTKLHILNDDKNDYKDLCNEAKLIDQKLEYLQNNCPDWLKKKRKNKVG